MPVDKALNNELTTRVASGDSAVWYHPGALQYLAGRFRGVK